MAIHDAATSPGIVLTCRIIGISDRAEEQTEGQSTAHRAQPSAEIRNSSSWRRTDAIGEPEHLVGREIRVVSLHRRKLSKASSSISCGTKNRHQQHRVSQRGPDHRPCDRLRVGDQLASPQALLPAWQPLRVDRRGPARASGSRAKSAAGRCGGAIAVARSASRRRVAGRKLGDTKWSSQPRRVYAKSITAAIEEGEEIGPNGDVGEPGAGSGVSGQADDPDEQGILYGEAGSDR
jgi:hypothetical protein